MIDKLPPLNIKKYNTIFNFTYPLVQYLLKNIWNHDIEEIKMHAF